MTRKTVFGCRGSAGNKILGVTSMNRIINDTMDNKHFVSIETNEVETDPHGNIIYSVTAACLPVTVFRVFERATTLFSRLINAVAKRTECESNLIYWLFATYRNKPRRATGHDTFKSDYCFQKRHEAV